MGKTKKFYIVLILLASALLYTHLIGIGREGLFSLEPSSFLFALEGWHGEEVSLRQFEEALLRPDSYLYLRYRCTELAEPVYVFLGYFRDQRIGFQIHSPLNCLPGSGWNLIQTEELEPAGLGFRVRKLLAERSGEYREVYYWFITSSETTHSEYKLKLVLLKSGLLLRKRDALFVRISVSGRGDETGARMGVFVARFAKALDDFLAASGWGEQHATVETY